MTHILITRPLESSQQLAKMLGVRGLSSIVMPQYEFAEKELEIDLGFALSESEGRKLAVFTSPRAVQFGLPLLADLPKDELEIAAIGPATRAKLKSCGYKVQVQAETGYTSEDLLQVPGLKETPGAAVIFCAPGGRKVLATGLEGLGWQVMAAEVYRRQPLSATTEQLDSLSQADSLISVWTSISALEIAEKHLPEASWTEILNAPAVVISARIQRHFENAGAILVEISDGPGNPELLQSVLRLSGHKTNGEVSI